MQSVGIRVYSDPYIVTVPDDQDEGSVLRWLASFEAWISEIEFLPEVWYCFAECALQLLENDLFPSFDRLRILQRKHNLDINIKRLAAAALKFFQTHSRDYLNACAIREVLADLQSQPAVLVERNPTCTRRKFMDALEVIAVDEHLRGGGGLIATMCSPEISDLTSISAVGYVDSCSPEDVGSSAFAREISVTIPVVQSPTGIGAAFSFRAAFLLGANFVARVIASCVADVEGQPLEFVVYNNFANSVRGLGLLANDGHLVKIVRMCVAVVVDDTRRLSNSYNLRPLRESAAANAAQRRRTFDKASAWRLTVIAEGIGIRAHYWRGYNAVTKRSFIEFVSLLRKHDPEDILESDI
ncbi:hypothetical protein [Nannocystis pusilla]|uniref:Uncharacterized protein n=1 Tax=Nannocystis pusilla TaxID=889268 RepID=A0ABS7TU05_9BACT|nr:hypothetical protein [Nannocystis pusilla]MBZ5711732.1 hypothetical protein [Nannocystis pusilla]